MRSDAQRPLAEADEYSSVAQPIVQQRRVLQFACRDADIRSARIGVGRTRQHAAVKRHARDDFGDEPLDMLPDRGDSQAEQELQRSIERGQIKEAGRLR